MQARFQSSCDDVLEACCREGAMQVLARPRRKNIGQTSDWTRASTIGKISAQPQLFRCPQTAPPRGRRSGRRDRIRVAPFPGQAHTSGPERTKPHQTSFREISDLRRPCYRNGRWLFLDRAQPFVPSRSSAREMSVPTISHSGSTRCRGLKVTSPVPQATSRRRPAS